jgi:hypothetical protein
MLRRFCTLAQCLQPMKERGGRAALFIVAKVANMIRFGWLVALVIGLLSEPVQAQHFSFSVGSHHGHYGHHHHHHDWSWHYCRPYYDPIYVYPAPRVTYVQPTVVPYQPVVQTPTPAATVQIWNAAGQRLPVAFLANARSVTLSDGQSHTLYGADKQTIEFDRGGGYGTARYELAAGEYEFLLTSRGWDLVARTGSTATASRPSVPQNTLPAGTAVR